MLGTKFTSFMGRPRVWNTSNNVMGASKMGSTNKSEFEIKNKAYTNEKDELLKDKQVYMNLKSEFKSFSQTLNEMATFKGEEKKVTTSQDGHIKVKANRDAIEGTFHMTVTQLAEHHQIVSNAINLGEKLNVNDVLQIGDKELQITSDMTYKDLIQLINNGDYGVNAYTQGDKVFMHAKKVGESNKIELKDGTSDLFKKMFYTPVKTSQIDLSDNTAQNFVLNTINPAKDAKYILNGIEGTSNSNTLKPLPGVEIELLKETTENSSGKRKELKFTVSNSGVSDATKLIKKMIADYNNIASSYEEFARPMGSLQGNAIMADIYREMNNVVRFSQGGNYLSTFGIQLTDDGTMKVNETKLTKVLEEHSGAAKQFFFSPEGLGKVMGKSFEEIFGDNSIISDRIKNINSRVNDLENKISYVDFYNKEKQDGNVDKYQRLKGASLLLNNQISMMRSMIR
ncbi:MULTISPECIES: flagellar hook-associated protein 2 [Bacillus cereus group]|uniref:flagellar hook-associated protein 2 n=1 Tax=Bacillus cereus group TaxID=86661 RepID=UPI000A3A32A2|nr:flagellar hook-associated protein 2 [Bacillus thuringiensis]MEB8736451.1 flagellar hook-associated protein 2 [Bacillus cereus]MEB8905279.1 flagellar hook-associated protein 2 [Bacillus cereus]MEB9986218.1 flagellar hook-associated protein 2 [Bacillus cereus]MEB9991436.1 flagellar hook-associated protein 2 [Bacillus cereus]MEC3111330.1 flagellar hook-associated protein 2 [Bacillus cereus]